jgi:FixJ family two-component response regulator
MNLSHTIAARGTSKDLAIPVIYVVDGDRAVCDALERVIRSAGWRPSLCGSAEEFLALPRVMSPGCLILEQELPTASGLELQRHIVDRSELPVIFMSSSIDVQTTVQAMRAGAIEFLTKPFVNDVLMHAMRYAIERSHAVLHHLALIHALQQRFESLSRREREVMRLVVTGRLNKQVGGDLGISEITVKAHRGNMMRKMQARSFAELVSMAARLHGETHEALSS